MDILLLLFTIIVNNCNFMVFGDGTTITSSSSILSLDIVSQYTLPNNSYFKHLVYDRRRNLLYAGKYYWLN